MKEKIKSGNCPYCGQIYCPGSMGFKCQATSVFPESIPTRDEDFNAAQFDADLAESDE
jgi:hypothetical protein